MDCCDTSFYEVRNESRAEGIFTTLHKEFEHYSTVEKLIKNIGDPSGP